MFLPHGFKVKVALFSFSPPRPYFRGIHRKWKYISTQSTFVLINCTAVFSYLYTNNLACSKWRYEGVKNSSQSTLKRGLPFARAEK
jgi:hypothetical protein